MPFESNIPPHFGKEQRREPTLSAGWNDLPARVGEAEGSAWMLFSMQSKNGSRCVCCLASSDFVACFCDRLLH